MAVLQTNSGSSLMHPSMEATASLLKASSFFVHRDLKPATLKWRNPSFLQRTTQIPPLLLLLPSIKKPTTGFIIPVQCVMNNNNFKNCFMEEEDDEERKRNQNPLNKRFAEVMMLAGGALFLACDPYSAAIAASGGRMGGDSFSSSSSSSSSSSPSSSYSSSSDDGFSSSPSFSFSISSPTSTHSMDKSWSNSERWSFFWFIIAGIAYIFICVYLESQTPIVNWLKGSTRSRSEGNTQTTTVLKLQVGLMGMKRSLQRDLDRIAETADTSTSKGLSYILQETTSLLLKHPSCCISGYSSVDVKQNIEDGEKLFNRLCIEERGKFDDETLVNVDNNKRQNTSSKGANGVSNEYIVITILVAAKGVHKLPAITGSADLKEALQKLGSISSNKTMAALEVLWTPQKENDTLTEQELHEDYPLLRPLYKDQDMQPLEKC